MRPASLRAVWLKAHRWLGLSLGGVLLGVALSGACMAWRPLSTALTALSGAQAMPAPLDRLRARAPGAARGPGRLRRDRGLALVAPPARNT